MVDPSLIDVLLRLDRVLSDLLEVRAALAPYLTPAPAAEGNVGDAHNADDLAPEQLLDTTQRGGRFNYPRNTITRWCREGAGVKVGGRWMASVNRAARNPGSPPARGARVCLAACGA